MLLGVGGFEMGAFGEPGPGVAPGVALPGVALPGMQGLATVAEVPGATVEDVVVDPVVAGPVPAALVEVPALVDVPVPVVLVVPGVVLDVLAVPVLIPLFDGVQGAAVFDTPELLVVVP